MTQEDSGSSAPSGLLAPHQVREIQESYLERTRPVMIIGPMAAGKSYLGLNLARFYGYEFLDSDQLISQLYGPIDQIFQEQGEAAFRQLESQVIAQVLADPARRNTIFSLGGGAPMTPAVAQLLAKETVIYVQVDAATVAPRLNRGKGRPLLQDDPLARWSQIFEARRARYEELASYTLDARGGRSLTQMTAELQDFILSSRKGN